MSFSNLMLIGDRINPQGFKSTARMIEADDIAGLQALAVRQVEAGSNFVDVTIGPRGYKDIDFLKKVIVALQEAVEVPLCIDYPVKHIVAECLKVYDIEKSSGMAPLVNSFAETRMEMFELFAISPCKVVVMASEYMDENGKPRPAKQSHEVVDVARRLVNKLVREQGMLRDDIFVDITINSLVSDTEGRTKMALTAIRDIGQDPDMQGVHIVGGLTNIGNMVPKLDYDGMSLRLCLENAFLTRAVPLGFDTVLGTPWNDFRPLPEDHDILIAFDETIALSGLDAMRRLRKIWAENKSA